MKKKLHLLFLLIQIFITSLSYTFAQGFVWQQTSGPTGGIIHWVKETPDGTLYAAGSYTIFKSIDNAQTWTNVNFEWDTSPLLIWNDKGDIFANSFSIIKKSTDDGVSWTETINLGEMIRDFSRNSKNYLFAATDSLIYRSVDGGDNWTVLSNLPKGSEIRSLSTTLDSNYYATTANGIYRSEDGGATWVNATGNLPLIFFGEIVTDKNGQVYVSSNSAIYTSTDKGTTWNQTCSIITHNYMRPVADLEGNIWICAGDKLFKWTGNDWTVVSSFDENDILIRILFTSSGSMYAPTYKGILKSTDNGTTWTDQNIGLKAAQIHSMAVGSENKLFARRNYDVCYSTDKGKNWTVLATGLEENNTQHISITANSAGTVVYTDNSNILVSADNGNNWSSPNAISSDRILSAAIDPDNNLYALSYDRIFFSENFGQDWEERYVWNEQSYYPKMATDDEGNIFVLTGNGIFKSADKGMSFTKITAPDNEAWYQDFIITRKGIIVAGNKYGIIRLTRNGEVLGNPVDPQEYDSSNRLLHQAQDGTIYMATSFKMYSSTDEGLTWNEFYNINNLNPDNCYITDDDGYLYSGTSRGVWKSSIPVLKIAPPVPAARPGDQQVTFTWNKNLSSKFKNYKIYGGINSYPDSVIYTSSDVNDTSVVFTNLANGTAYYFVVAAEDIDGNESFSNSFKVITSPFPGVPELVSPADGEINLSGQIGFMWKDVQFAKTYTIQVFTDSSLSAPAFQYFGYPYNTIEAPKLKSGTKYYWRVGSANLTGTSGFSSAWHFTTLLEAPELTAETAGIEKNRLAWVNKSSVSPSYIIERGTDGLPGYKVLDTVKTGETSYTDGTAASEVTYKYRVKAYTDFAVSEYSNEAVVTTITDVKDNNPVPTEYAVKQNYPNPFNPSTMIEYSLPYESNVKIVVYNSLGETVAELADGIKSTGVYNVNFNAASLSSGIYFCSIKAESTDGKNKFNSIKKMMLVK